jgi:hypothetical protein
MPALLRNPQTESKPAETIFQHPANLLNNPALSKWLAPLDEKSEQMFAQMFPNSS